MKLFFAKCFFILAQIWILFFILITLAASLNKLFIIKTNVIVTVGTKKARKKAFGSIDYTCIKKCFKIIFE